ncbi:hypothetical protein F5880DRAFT_1512380 [Lentinula raphanica]|nr:hypothetical protein F5880DRAFT_1512380 [Lentinula raphanica]
MSPASSNDIRFLPLQIKCIPLEGTRRDAFPVYEILVGAAAAAHSSNTERESIDLMEWAFIAVGLLPWNDGSCRTTERLTIRLLVGPSYRLRMIPVLSPPIRVLPPPLRIPPPLRLTVLPPTLLNTEPEILGSPRLLPRPPFLGLPRFRVKRGFLDRVYKFLSIKRRIIGYGWIVRACNELSKAVYGIEGGSTGYKRELRLRTVEITLNHRNRLVLTREAIAFPGPSLTLPDLREKLMRRRSEAPSFSSSQLVYLNAPSISTSKKIPGWPWKYLFVLVCTLDAFFNFLHRLYLLSPLFLSWIAESLIIFPGDPRFSSSPALSRSSTFVNVSSDVSFAGLVSATYALPNPGLRHFQPRSDTEADAQPAVGNHTFGLTRRGESSAARTSNPAEGSAGTTAPYFVKGLTSRPGYNIPPVAVGASRSSPISLEL